MESNRLGRSHQLQHIGRTFLLPLALTLVLTPALSAFADTFSFSTGQPDGRIGTLSGPATPGQLETETADDFVTTEATTISSATFYGLLPAGTPLSSVTGVDVELYHVFPDDSTNPPDGGVDTRTNSPSDNSFAARNSLIPGQLSFTTTLLNSSFTAANSVVNGINPKPNQFTGGEGPVTGEEVLFNVTFTTPFVLGADHVFFSPEVAVTGGDFLWLSAPKPIVPPGTPFSDDLQTWIRTDGPGGLAPDWSRVGTDITGEGPDNAAFTLSGETPSTAPEPSILLLLGAGLMGLFGFKAKRSAPQD